MSITSVEIAWVAGLIEGEGCFRLSKWGTSRIQIGMTDLDVLEKFRKITNTSHLKITVVPKEKQKTHYQTSINGITAIQWMMTIYPLMGIRRKEKIKKMLDIWKNRVYKSIRNPHPEQVRDKKYRNSVKSLMLARNISREEAMALLDNLLGRTETVQ